MIGTRPDGASAALVAVLAAAFAGAALVGCTKASSPDGAPSSPSASTSGAGSGDAASLVEKGKKSYRANCIACHNLDPAKDGSVGPAVAGSSLELLEARVLKASYPPGYQPKRPSAAMPALPHLKDDVPALHAYLNAKP